MLHLRGIARYNLSRAVAATRFQDNPFLTKCARRRLVSKVGKPVLVRQGGQAEGGWGRDCFRKAFNASRSFVTLDNDPNTLLEFVNGKLAKRHALPYPFRGNSHVVYNNVFYYHQMNTRSLVRYDLENKTSAALDIDDVAFGRSSRVLVNIVMAMVIEAAAYKVIKTNVR